MRPIRSGRIRSLYGFWRLFAVAAVAASLAHAPPPAFALRSAVSVEGRRTVGQGLPRVGWGGRCRRGREHCAKQTPVHGRHSLAGTSERGEVRKVATRDEGEVEPDEKPRESVGTAVTRPAPGAGSWRPVEHLTRSVRATRSAVIRTTYGFLQGKSSLRERCGMRSRLGFAPLTGSRITLTMSSSPVPVARSVQSS
jgi:hypothetical protein